jgi:putative DNA primase/helicase
MTELAAMEGVHIPADKHSPASLTRSLDTKHIVAANNCLMDIKTLPPKQTPLTEDFYTLNYLPFDYDPAAVCPQWKAFLESVFTERRLSKKTEYDNELGDFVEQYEHVPDALAIEILGEWFGYLLSGQTHLQKIFGLIGERRSGKSTIGRVLRALNGTANTASPTLSSLATEFGLQGLMNKTIAVIGDANAAGRSGDAARAVERLKSISGEDGQQINRKNKSYIEVEKLPVRFVLIANKMQDLRDSTGALASRFNILVTTQTFLGREDHRLGDRLLTELPGIFNWAMDGLARLRKRGYLKEHPTGIEARDDFEAMSSPMKAFIEDWCVVADSATVPVDILWKAHSRWAKENGNKGFSKRKFIVELKGACNGVKRERQRLDVSQISGTYKWDIGDGDNRASILKGIDLKKECSENWKSGTDWDSGTGYGTGYPYET